MDPEPLNKESFEEFKDSFSYGMRSDLNFKFIKALSEHEASEFFQELLWELSTSLDDGNLSRLLEHVYKWQVTAYDGHGRWTYEDGPFTRMEKPISESTIGLIASSGHFVEDDDPQPFGVIDMTQEEATGRIVDFLKNEPVLSRIPADTPLEKLKVRHGGYDIRSAQVDPNVVFPLERLRELRDEGLIGELSPTAFSFVGATSQRKLLNRVGPEWVKIFQQSDMEGVILIPV